MKKISKNLDQTVKLWIRNNIPNYEQCESNIYVGELNKYSSEYNKKNKIQLSGEDIKEGLTLVLSIKMPDPKFSSQTKDKLVSSEVKKVIELGIYTHMMHYLEEHPKIADTILKKIEEASRAREAARKARDISRKSDQLSLDVKLSSKLAE